MDIPQSTASGSQPTHQRVYESRPIRQVREIVIRGDVSVIFRPGTTPEFSLVGKLKDEISSVKTSLTDGKLMIERDVDVARAMYGVRCMNINGNIRVGKIQVCNEMTFDGIRYSGSSSVYINGRCVTNSNGGGPVLAAIRLPVTPDITHRGSGRVELHEVHQREIALTLSGFASMKAAGRVEELTIDASGQSKLDASALQARCAELKVSGQARTDAMVVRKVHADICDMADVRIAGNPPLRTSAISGMAALNYL